MGALCSSRFVSRYSSRSFGSLFLSPGLSGFSLPCASVRIRIRTRHVHVVGRWTVKKDFLRIVFISYFVLLFHHPCRSFPHENRPSPSHPSTHSRCPPPVKCQAPVLIPTIHSESCPPSNASQTPEDPRRPGPPTGPLHTNNLLTPPPYPPPPPSPTARLPPSAGAPPASNSPSLSTCLTNAGLTRTPPGSTLITSQAATATGQPNSPKAS